MGIPLGEKKERFSDMTKKRVFCRSGRKILGMLAGTTLLAMGQPVVRAQSNTLEVFLLQLRTQDVTPQHLGTMYLLRTNAPSAEILEAVVKACGAGLLYLGQHENYRARIRGHISDVISFEQRMRAVCGECKGNGRTEVLCPKCKGDGTCKNFNCEGGKCAFRTFEGWLRYRQCPACRGTGICPECGGKGVVDRTCLRCGGKGGFFSPSLALACFRQEVETAIGAFEAKRRNEQWREVEIAAKREAILAEAKALGEERARLESQAAREAAERARKEAEEARYAEVDKTFLKSVVVIEGDRGVGTGFFCEFKGKSVILSNAHVLFGNRSIKIRTLQGTELPCTHVMVCTNRDIAAFFIDRNDGLPALSLLPNVADMNNQETVVVFGNSGGRGVVTTLRGRMRGIGPDKVEVDATFVHGNSGSPIIAYDYKQVVGMATYAVYNPEVDWVNKNTRFAEVRRFGVRLDNVGWSDFILLDEDEYRQSLEVFEDMVSFMKKVMMLIIQRGTPIRFSEQTKIEARVLLNRYLETPEWMRRLADDAALAAFVCMRILEL